MFEGNFAMSSVHKQIRSDFINGLRDIARFFCESWIFISIPEGNEEFMEVEGESTLEGRDDGENKWEKEEGAPSLNAVKSLKSYRSTKCCFLCEALTLNLTFAERNKAAKGEKGVLELQMEGILMSW